MPLDGWANIPIAIQGLGAGLGFMAELQGTKTAYTAARMKAAADEFNGVMAGMALQRKAAQWQIQGIRMHSSQVVSGATAGIDLGSQSFQLLQQETLQNFMNDAQYLRETGAFNALMAKTQADSAVAIAGAEKSGNRLGALASLLNFGAQAYTMWGGMGGT